MHVRSPSDEDQTPSLKHVIATWRSGGRGEELQEEMAALKVNLIEHISKDNQTVCNIAVGNADLPICHSVGEEVKICTSASDAAGASAILCTLDPFLD